MLTKKSYSILLNNTLQRTFNEPINSENCEIALVAFSISGLFKIDDSNNTFEYNYKDSGWNEIKIKNNCYSIISLERFINNQLDINLHKLNNNIVLHLGNNLKVRFGKSAFGDLLGFKNNKIYETGKYISERNFNNKITDYFSIHLNCIKNSFIDEKINSVIHASFFTSGCNINEKLNTLIYYPMNEKVKNFKVEIKDMDGEDIQMDYCSFYFHIRN